MTGFRSAALIVNARSRKGQQTFDRARAALADLPCPVDAHAVADPAALPDTVRRALANKPELVVLGGGDGTISSLVDLLVGQDVVLGVLPLGTANSFARTLGLPLEVEGAVEVLRTGRRRRIDLGLIDDDYFCSTAAMGVSPLIAETVPHGLKKVLGRAGYLGWAAWQFARFRPFTLIVGEGEAAERLTVSEVRISNGPFHGGIELVDAAGLNTGEIVVQAVCGSRKGLLRNWAAGALHLAARDANTRDFRGRSLRIATDPPQPISIDGEVLARTPVTARVAPGVIEVMVPA